MSEVQSVKDKTSGFTLVELMVVVLLVAMVVLVSTQVPLFTFGFWREGTERLRMQRDANYAMIYIQRRLRPASFTVAPVVPIDDGVVSNSLTIGGDTFEVDTDNYDLVENGSTVISGDEGTEFIVERNGRAIKMTLTLARGSGRTTHRTAVKLRN